MRQLGCGMRLHDFLPGDTICGPHVLLTDVILIYLYVGEFQVIAIQARHVLVGKSSSPSDVSLVIEV